MRKKILIAAPLCLLLLGSCEKEVYKDEAVLSMPENLLSQSIGELTVFNSNTNSQKVYHIGKDENGSVAINIAVSVINENGQSNTGNVFDDEERVASFIGDELEISFTPSQGVKEMDLNPRLLFAKGDSLSLSKSDGSKYSCKCIVRDSMKSSPTIRFSFDYYGETVETSGGLVKKKYITPYVINAFLDFELLILYFGYDTNGYEYVDLGLPSGTVWASCNIGAEANYRYGIPFAWGEVYDKFIYGWENYSFYITGKDTTDLKYSKYITPSLNRGPVDNLKTLELEDDAAHKKLQGGWLIPTCEEWQELIDSCTWIWRADYNGTGINGLEGTSKINECTIFFPASGITASEHVEGGIVYRNVIGIYWSSTLYEEDPLDARVFEFSDIWGLLDLPTRDHDYPTVYVSEEPRWYGIPIRPVCHKSVFSY